MGWWLQVDYHGVPSGSSVGGDVVAKSETNVVEEEESRVEALKLKG